MLHIVLFEPEIPPNTGNIMRLCANSGAALHLVHPMGFEITEAQVRRAGMDYRDMAVVREYPDWDACMAALGERRKFFLSTHNSLRHDQPRFADEDVFVFGPESRGLPEALRNSAPDGQRLRIPMVAGSRSLNLSNSVAVVLYEAWRQLDFAGAVSNHAE